MSVTMGGEDPDSLDFERLNDLYVVDNLAMGEMEEMPDIFSADAPPIDDSPEAAAAFDSFVNELNGTMVATVTSAPQHAEGVLTSAGTSPDTTSGTGQFMGANVAMTTSVGAQSSSTSYSSALSTQTAMNAEDYPDRLDLHALGAHALPLNVAEDASLHAAATRSSTPYGNGVNLLLSDSDTLSAHLALPTRSWSVAGATPSTRLPQHDTMVPISHTTAASRGRPRVREMRHVPERGVSMGAIGGNASAPAAAAKLRYSKGAAPSKYCHVCGRSAKTVSVALCGNNQLGLCRKVVCDKCLLMHQRDSWEVAKRAGAGWICMHCRNLCPERARCHQYQRNNLKRRLRAAAPPTPNASASTANIRRAATGRVMKGVRANTATRRTSAVNEVASAALCASNMVQNDMARGGLHVADSATDLQMLDEVKMPQMIAVTTVTDHNPITPAELHERENQIDNRNLNKSEDIPTQVMLDFNPEKAEQHPVSMYSTPAKQIVNQDEHMIQLETRPKQEVQSHAASLIQDAETYASDNMLVSNANAEVVENDRNEENASANNEGVVDVERTAESEEKQSS